MQCPSCKETIDDDSRYCDSCGKQIFVCSACGRPGTGKRCIHDGKEMIAAGTSQQQSPQAAVDNIAQNIQPTPTTQPAPAATSVANDKIKLMSQSRGVSIEASDGDIIGRKTGPFAAVFANFSHVSGTHCKIIKQNSIWHIQDMGSTNGTIYNNNRLPPNTPVPVSNNTKVKVADIDLLITFTSDEGGTTRI